MAHHSEVKRPLMTGLSCVAPTSLKVCWQWSLHGTFKNSWFPTLLFHVNISIFCLSWESNTCQTHGVRRLLVRQQWWIYVERKVRWKPGSRAFETTTLDKGYSPTAPKWEEEQSGSHYLVQPTVQQASLKAMVPAQLWCHPRSQIEQVTISTHMA